MRFYISKTADTFIRFFVYILAFFAIVLLFSLVSCQSPSSREFDRIKSLDYSQAVVFTKDSAILTVNFPHGDIICGNKTRSLWRNTKVTVEQTYYGSEITKPIITAFGKWNKASGIVYDPDLDLTVVTYHAYIYDFEKLTPANDTIYDR